jgi:hypothetical protein
MQWSALEALATAVAAVFALFAWLTSQQTLRLSYRPVLRPVALWKGPRQLEPSAIKVKNIGNGPAVAVCLVAEDRHETILATAPIVERLGERGDGDEATRVGNTLIRLTHGAIEIGRAYRLFCQDIGGTWHETRFTVSDSGFTIKFLGPKTWWKLRNPVPASVRTRGQVATVDEQ